MRIVTETGELKELSAELEQGPYVAIDTEFMRDQTYWPKLCLIQAAGPGVEAIIDPLAEGIDLTPFHRLLAAKSVVKVFHAARQDVEIFHHQGGVIPNPLFDTQIAAMVCGFGDSASYETLVRKLAKADIDKSARFTDWSRRPLSKRQLEYALADVTHLRQIYEILSKELEKTGRAKWVEEEEATLTDPATYRLDPVEAWRRLKPRTGNKRFLQVLAGIAAWREREAQTRDVPRNRILKDEALLEIASHPPPDAEHLGQIRALPNGYANSRAGKALMNALKESLASPPPELMLPPERRSRHSDPSPAALDLLKTLLRLRATQYRVAPRLVAGSDDLERLAAGENEGIAALHGWRAEVFGNDAVALREGRLAIALENGEAVVIETGAEKKPRAKRGA
ncbi:MAG TPA: ribonuclease D [Micropepsaceae bacterium]|jgi:ribonuclease D|nr:ribonuclease D [Micropepsaceae bacterium]